MDGSAVISEAEEVGVDTHGNIDIWINAKHQRSADMDIDGKKREKVGYDLTRFALTIWPVAL